MVINLICPKCLSKNTVYKQNGTFECKDCSNEWKKEIEIKLTKNSELLKDILEEDKKKNKRIPNISISQNSLERRKE